MKIKLEVAKEGCILSEDVFLLSGKPFMTKGTVLTKELVEILEKFLVTSICVEERLENGKLYKTTSSNEKSNDTIVEYKDSIKAMTKLYHKVSSGLSLHFSDIQPVMTPLIELIKNSDFLFRSDSKINMAENVIIEKSIQQAILSFQIGEKLNLEYHDCVQLLYAGALCNIGLAKIENRILQNLQSVTEKEKSEYQKHPAISYSIISKMDYLRSETKLAILQHHEVIDGSGYPFKLKENKIHLFSQIVGITERYTDLLLQQADKKRYTYIEVVQAIHGTKHKQYNHKIVDAILSVIFPIQNNHMVLLSDGTQGRIVYVNPQNIFHFSIERNGEIIDLSKGSSVYILKVI